MGIFRNITKISGNFKQMPDAFSSIFALMTLSSSCRGFPGSCFSDIFCKSVLWSSALAPLS